MLAAHRDTLVRAKSPEAHIPFFHPSVLKLAYEEHILNTRLKYVDEERVV